MARIRTIKPDFWTDERLTECSLSTRLFFIGMWNFADDRGNLGRSAKKLKMQIFPADMIDCEPLIIELIAHGVLTEYTVNGEKFLQIKNFLKHQVINRPSNSSIPQPVASEPEVITHGVITEGRESEGKGMEEEIPPSPAKLPTCPVDAIVTAYHRILPEMPAVRLMSDKRKRAIGGFWTWVLKSERSEGVRRAETKEQAMEWIEQFFDRARANDFLMGRTHKTGDHEGWQCDLDFLLTEKGMKQVIEKTKATA